jgi:CrcB protein
VNVLAVVVGALVGTGLRLGIDALIPHRLDEFPLSTLLINVVGSFALGLLVARVWPVAPAWLRFGLGTGVLGSFTTFSAVIVSVVILGPVVGVAYLVITLIAGFAAAALGLSLGRPHDVPRPDLGADE